MLTEPLLEKTYRMLDASEFTSPEIATGSGVDINWLSKFKQRRIDEPGVSKVQRVHDFLSRYAPQKIKRQKRVA